MRVLGFRTAVAVAALLAGMGTASAADEIIYTDQRVDSLASAVSGYVEGRYGMLQDVQDVDGTANVGIDTDLEGNEWTLRGSVNARAGSFNAQIEADLDIVDAGLVEGNALRTTLHAYYRPIGGAFAAGAFLKGSYGKSEALVGSDGHVEADVFGAVAGLEAAYLGQFATFHLRAGAGLQETDIAGLRIEADRVHVGANTNLYFGDNFRLDLDGTYDRLEHELFDADRFAFDARANYRFGARPVSVFAGYRHEAIETRSKVDGTETEFDTGTLYAGARLHFGSDSLRQEERSGALWETYSREP